METKLPTAIESIGLAMFAFSIWVEQRGIRAALHKISNQLTALLLKMGLEDTGV